ncbi:MAG: hypothetical protein HFJ43_01900 [Clostridia bacterium]|nr:hypothetical protein [Clostridia bacterium]
MENKRIRKILIFFLVVNLIILLFAIISVINKEKDETKISNSNKKYIDNKSEIEEKKKGFKNIEILYKNYKGEIPKSNISDKIEIVANQYFNILFENIIKKNKDVAEYFNKNKKSIKNRFGITNLEDFRSLIEQLQKLNCSVKDYYSYEVLENSFSQEENYTKCILVYTYNNGQEIKFDLYIKNTTLDENMKYIFIPKK